MRWSTEVVKAVCDIYRTWWQTSISAFIHKWGRAKKRCMQGRRGKRWAPRRDRTTDLSLTKRVLYHWAIGAYVWHINKIILITYTYNTKANPAAQTCLINHSLLSDCTDTIILCSLYISILFSATHCKFYKYLYNHHHALIYLLSDMVVFLRGLLLVHVVCELLLGE